MTIALLSVFSLLGPVTAESLDPYLWNSRPIVIFAAEGDPLIDRQLARFKAERAALIERDNVLILETRPDAALTQRFRPDGFTVILVGKDGAEKFRATEVIAPEVLLGLIDTMPMRRREMRAQP